ncbi:MAG: DUF438 domain-containing protein [Eubacterium sp.]|nr:DUF438 domain-containing protein [Eubacterium sp.]
MAKSIDLSKTVYELVKEYPELKGIMADLGFKDILNPVRLNTIGRVMTIPKGAVMKGIDMREILSAFEKNGFEAIGLEKDDEPERKQPEAEAAEGKNRKGKNTEGKETQAAQPEDYLARFGNGAADDLFSKTAAGLTEEAKLKQAEEEKRNDLLESYVRRLSQGEDLETVRGDFVENFKDVDALEIANAEQKLIQSGMPVSEVQKLCDVHSALFHGATREERIANEEEAVNASLKGQPSGTASIAAEAMKQTVKKEKEGQPAGRAAREQAKSKMQQLSVVMGHPVYTLVHENKLVAEEIKKIRHMLAEAEAEGTDLSGTGKEEMLAELDTVRSVVRHYAKKGDLIYPVLKTRYNVSGPSDVMWGVDDEIRDELSALKREAAGQESLGKDWRNRLNAVLTRADEMIYKENNILLPICVQFFTDEEWYHIYHELKQYRPTMLDGLKIWPEGEAFEKKEQEAKKAEISDQEVVLPGGHLTPRQIAAILNTIPAEITFIDDQDINRFFNSGKEEKLFKRPDTALDRSVYTCHPPKYEAMTRQVIKDLKGGKDSVDIWMVKEGQPVLVRYMAVRDGKGYVGTMEFVQKMKDAAEHFGK